MTVKKFVKKLTEIIDNSGDFETDLIDMEEIKDLAKLAGFDDVIYVAGENEDEVFVLSVQKIK